jgi:hypothetical protein
MTRGLLVPLSSNEETTLRRITYGLVAPGDLSKRDVERLTSLALIMARGNSIALTPLGEQRVAQLSNNVLGAKPLDSNAVTRQSARAGRQRI